MTPKLSLMRGEGNYNVIVDGLIFTKKQLIRDLELLSGHCAPYHVCDDESCTWEDVINTVGKILGIEPLIVHVPVEALKIYHRKLYDEVRYNKMAEVTLDNSLIKTISPNVNYRVPLIEGLSGTVKFLQENYSTRPLDDYFNFMCDAILASHKEFTLNPDEDAAAEEYVKRLSGDYLLMLRSMKYMRKAVNILRPARRIIRKILRI